MSDLPTLETPQVSVVIATYNRIPSLLRLLRQLDAQAVSVPFEVRVVDDGSADPVAPHVARERFTYPVFVEQQPNSGAASARHRGVLLSRGDLVVFVDDDMQVGPDFLDRHVRRHADGERRVVLGRIERDPSVEMPLFEKWHAAMLDKLADGLRTGAIKVRGNHLFTGNASLRRADYLAVGGFDPSLPHSEDAELGLRLERAGCELVFADDAVAVHGSDHQRLDKWLQRSFTYGLCDAKIGFKHPDLDHANPWRFLDTLNPLLRPLLAGAVAWPERFEPVAAAAVRAGVALDRAGLSRMALAGTTAAFAIQYFRGLRSSHGTLLRTAAGALRYRARRSPGFAAAWSFARGVVRDHRTMRRYERKYGHHSPSRGGLLSDVVQKIGLQQLVAYRAMRLFRELRLSTLAKITARINRHLYGSDLHWDAELAPGVMLVHGFGLAISHAARVSEGCILFHNVTLGMGTDPLTRQTGAPTLERNVHVGPGATLLGPITVGANSKIMAGAVVTRSVPPNSVVETSAQVIRPRGEAAPTPPEAGAAVGVPG